MKVYHSEKRTDGDLWSHERILLKPDSHDSSFTPIILTPETEGSFAVIGEFITVLS